ncbi:MAG: 4-(cytidine 5'-diphospho)-2-C-methyl-D-erythritol kinase [Cyclobacteriaceae bacterium]
MVVFPNAKINLGLHIVRKREDGYHDLETCFVPIPLRDILEIIEGETFQLDTSGLSIPGQAEENLCVKAYRLLQQAFDLPPVHIHLHKIIPMGGGLGGGSADASFVLGSLNELFELSLDDDQLEKYAGQLGSDCPFFIRNEPVLATGTGNQFQPLNLTLKGKYVVLVFPDISVSTAEAYAGVKPQAPQTSLKTLLESGTDQWKELLVNDFESSVFARHPVLETIKGQLYEAGAGYASMSGSGATLYGLFDQEPDLTALSPSYPTWKSQL